jgi:cysteine-rich repeat protein
VAGQEACDDGNKVDGDGCSSECMVEVGWSCASPTAATAPPPPQTRWAAARDAARGLAGFGVRGSVRHLRDAAGEGGGGPVQVGSQSSCRTVCGDGFMKGTEECDDGNAEPGDGASPT